MDSFNPLVTNGVTAPQNTPEKGQNVKQVTYCTVGTSNFTLSVESITGRGCFFSKYLPKMNVFGFLKQK